MPSKDGMIRDAKAGLNLAMIDNEFIAVIILLLLLYKGLMSALLQCLKDTYCFPEMIASLSELSMNSPCSFKNRAERME
jgi:hypothetical protein